MEKNQKRLDLRLKEKNALLKKNFRLTMKLAQRDVFGEALPWVILVFVIVAGGMFATGYWAAN